MSIHELTSFSSGDRGLSIGNNHFSTRQPLRNVAEKNPLSIRTGQMERDAFIRAGEDILSPPCFNWKPLDSFLRRAWLADLSDPKPSLRASKMCLIDDRSWVALDLGEGEDEDSLDTEVDMQLHSRENRSSSDSRPLSYDHVFRKMSMNRNYIFGYLRRFITNLTPLCAIALAATIAKQFATELKVFLQAHLLGEIYSYASTQSPRPCPPPRDRTVEQNITQTHLDVTSNSDIKEAKFSIMFHLSYVALREGPQLADPRGIRQSYSMIKSIDSSSEDELFYYDAQISFLVTGIEENQWTAYCIVDTFMGSEQDTETYLVRNQDGPSGGARSESQPCWNPREYFLLVLSQRIKQTTREWANVISMLMERLDAYESHYIRSIDMGDLRDNNDMSQTRSYMKAVSILHQLHDTLFAQLESLQAFLDDNVQYFVLGDRTLDNHWHVCYFDRIRDEMVHLRRWERRLMQRMTRFDGMKDGLIGSSALLESRRSTKQGDDIGVLTNMTVAYLPFNLAAGIFSISSKTPPKGLVWVYWAVTSVMLGVVTFYLAFWKRIRNHSTNQDVQYGKHVRQWFYEK